MQWGRWTVSISLGLAAALAPAWAQGAGHVEGTVVGSNGRGLENVTVRLSGRVTDTRLTDSAGTFRFDGVPSGSYELLFTLGQNTTTRTVSVTPDTGTHVEEQVDWRVSRVETITVYSASREREKITEAPAAISVVSEQQIEMQASTGQLPKLLETTTGAEPTQSGLYDFNFNTRGFNSSLNRRVLVLIDGRDPSVPFLGAQEWAAVSFPLDDLASVELVRGASSALYGGNAYNGVLNMTTESPRLSQGGMVRVAGGELDSARVDFRYATDLGKDWYFKVNGGYTESDDFALSRDRDVEYSQPCVTGVVDENCLELEAIPLQADRDEIGFATVRFDKQFSFGHVLTFEGGSADVEGPVFQTGIGRVQTLDAQRPWGRINYNSERFNVLAYYNGSDRDMVSLSSGGPLFLDNWNTMLELQANTPFWGGKGRLIGGVSYGEEDIDSENPETGLQTLMFAPVDSDEQAVFGQMDLDLTDHLKLVLAARWDDSSLHEAQFSPKAALVYKLNDDHGLRFSFNEAFQRPNYSEFFLQVDVAEPIDLAGTEGLLAALGRLEDEGMPAAPVLGGFPRYSGVRALALGNDDLDVEEIRSFEIGYTGIIGNKAFLTVDYYYNELSQFITDLITNVDPALPSGRVNPDFGPHEPPPDLPDGEAVTLEEGLDTLQSSLNAAVADPDLVADLEGFFAAVGDPNPAATANETFVGLATLAAIYPLLSNNLNQDPIFGVVSYANFGEVDTQGIEIGLNYYFTNEWSLDFSYSWFDFDIQEELTADPILPNAPEHKFSTALTYSSRKFDASVRWRWVDDFQWAAGVFNGPVDSYNLVSLVANYRFDNGLELGLDVSNLLDDEHYQSFGGDILERRAIASLGYKW